MRFCKNSRIRDNIWPSDLLMLDKFLGAKAPLELANLVTVTVHRHKKVSKMQDLARPSYIRYLPICNKVY